MIFLLLMGLLWWPYALLDGRKHVIKLNNYTFKYNKPENNSCFPRFSI